MLRLCLLALVMFATPGIAQRKVPPRLDAPAERSGRDARAVARARAAELARVGALALQEGAYDRAKALFVEAVTADPRRVRDHARIGQAFRGLGDPIGAAYHLRLWLHAAPDDADAERITRYLRR